MTNTIIHLPKRFSQPHPDAVMQAMVPATVDGMSRVDGINALTLLVEEHGVESVYRWLRTTAHIHGQDLPKWDGR
jgi:hypothetical protein